MKHCTGSIFDSKAAALVNPVNCVGVMGAGLAKEFKRRYPRNYSSHVLRCSLRQVRPGAPSVFYDKDDRGYRVIINFPTKDHWRDPSKPEWIMRGLETLSKWLNTDGPALKSIAFPLLGCGLGGLKPEDVTLLIEAFASEVKAEVELWTPNRSRGSS